MDVIPRIPLQLMHACVVASIQVELTDEMLQQFRADLLGRIRDSAASGVIFDVSGLEIMDREDFRALRQIMSMAKMMGARSIIAGLRPGIVASLVELGADVDGVEAVIDLDDALQLMEPQPTDRQPSLDGDAENEPEPENESEPENQCEPEIEPDPEPDTDGRG
jgi:rsbT antagonist protein RsbS